MVLKHVGLLLSSALLIQAQHGTSSPASSTTATSTTSPKATLTPSSGGVPLFPFEEQQWSQASLDKLRGPQRRLFAFDKTRVTHDTQKKNPPASGPGPHAGVEARCKVYPGDPAWPSLGEWKLFNRTLDGALIKGVPAADVCYFNGTARHDEGACAKLAANWTSSYAHLNDPIEMFSPVYQGLTCQPPSWYDSGGCTQGGYPTYTVNVSTTAQLQVAVNFARNQGLRFVIKNTGHDFSGKSGGAGSLSVWVHNLKDIAYFPSYNDATTDYNGPAFKAGAGVQVYEIYAAARDHGLVTVGGEGQTVGAMGGYVQGGGHSPLSSLLGMAADQVLNYEVVTADGRFVTANAKENPDLFWALRGGGGSTFGVVTSAVIKAHPDMKVTSTTFSFGTNSVSHKAFWAGFRAYLNYFPTNVAHGTYSYFFILPSSNDLTFLMQPFFAPNMSKEDTEKLLAPWMNDLSELGIDIEPEYKEYSTFWDAWNASFPLEAIEKTHVASASRLWPRTNWDNETILNTTFDAIRSSADAGLTTIAFNQAPTWAAGGKQDTAVNPAWRETICHMISSVSWPMYASVEEQMQIRHNFTFYHMQRWRDASPGAGSYLSESDRLEPNFQWAFYGNYYPKLLELKRKFDPKNVFWAATAVGSEFFQVESVDGLPNENGPLCKKDDPNLYVAEGPDWVPSEW
ncbi:FAD/FMN-containing isoamyl alcohol oxidase MreA [Hortaea werneckii]|nr:FAD/FMN-containing isoamyl alcohol oxidase MreA [Hortaea werneckii]KAI7093301.1 FAD/FMN-containing isoamyl alcohol oxidase MreA [Hortaea werneckii]KAI7311723.1 FAD/FMN-containing isoamyl alcohol oxidase MreA [Hortaea werneckii]KAI7386690.1 FAD/FMN-containing isoamyl alcohol oxidase MreA [Hortaea werneckii]